MRRQEVDPQNNMTAYVYLHNHNAPAENIDRPIEATLLLSRSTWGPRSLENFPVD